MLKVAITTAGIMAVSTVMFYSLTSDDLVKNEVITKEEKNQIYDEQKKITTVDIKNIIEEKKLAKQEKIVPHYKDVFKDIDLDDIEKRLKKDEELLDIVKKDAKQLIEETNALIAKHNLKLPEMEISIEEKKRLEELDNKILSINKKIQEFNR